MRTRPVTFALAVLAAFAAGALLPPSAMTQMAQKPEGAYLQVAYMKVAPGKGQEYLALEQDLWMPVHKERLKTGKIRSWSLYGLRSPGGSETPYNFAVLTAYDKWQDLEDFGYPDLFKRIHPDKPIADVGRRTTEARDMVRVEIWDLIDQVK
jgi:hypothetical protein